MKLKSILGAAGQIAATAAATATNPALGAGVGSALLGGAAGKAAGDKLQKLTGRQLDKITGPAGAIAAPLALAPILGALGLDMGQLCAAIRQVLETVCASPAGASGAVSLSAIALYMLAKSASRAGSVKKT